MTVSFYHETLLLSKEHETFVSYFRREFLERVRELENFYGSAIMQHPISKMTIRFKDKKVYNVTEFLNTCKWSDVPCRSVN